MNAAESSDSEGSGPAPPRTEGALFELPPVREVEALRAFTWLKRGASDFGAHPLPSLFYGLCFAGMGLLLLIVFRFAIDYTSTLAMGFMLAGPILAIGLYDLSRQRETGDVKFLSSLTAWRRNPGGIGIYVLILTIAFLVWARASMVTFALFEARALPTWSAFFVELAALKNLTFVAAFFGVGLLFAVLVFVLSALSIPYLYDQRSDAVTAAALSVTAIAKNPAAMTLWAFAIVLLILAGLVSFYLGLIVTGPLIGHATWHAYRDLTQTP